MGTNSYLIYQALCLQQYNFEIEHKKGKLHDDANGLRRKKLL